MSKSSRSGRRRQLAQVLPLTIVSLGGILSLCWAALLVWLVVHALGMLM
jgi:hypothetical protein